MKIGVIAGTPMDTQMGVDFVKSKGFEAEGRRCANSPEEQHQLQVFHAEELTDMCIAFARELKDLGCNGILIYCNSLSGAIDLTKLRAASDIRLVTPLDVYAELGLEYRYVMALAANCNSLLSIEKACMSKSKDMWVCGAALGQLVEAIETSKSKDFIFHNMKVKQLLESFDAMGCDAIILGCTHFPYLLPEARDFVNVPLIDPAEKMLTMLTE